MESDHWSVLEATRNEVIQKSVHVLLSCQGPVLAPIANFGDHCPKSHIFNAFNRLDHLTAGTYNKYLLYRMKTLV